jgi:hypothetical protein
MLEPLRWTEEQLARDLRTAMHLFRKTRMEESLEAYLQPFDKYSCGLARPRQPAQVLECVAHKISKEIRG